MALRFPVESSPKAEGGLQAIWTGGSFPGVLMFETSGIRALKQLVYHCQTSASLGVRA